MRFLKGGGPHEPGRGGGGKVREPKFLKNLQDGNRTYELYVGDDAEAAKAWLLTKKVDKPLYYITV